MKRVINHGRVRFMVNGKDPLTGARKRLFYETAAEAKAKERELAAEAVEPLHPLCDPDVTLARYGQTWLDAHAGGWAVRTLRSYSDTFRLHVAPLPLGGGLVLGDVMMRDLHRGHVKTLVITKKREGQSPASVRLMFVTLNAIADAAIGDRLLRAHPADQALRKELKGHMRTAKSQPKPFTVPQMQTFLQVAREHSTLHPLYVVGFTAGLRLGELSGLQLNDLSTGAKPKLHITRQLGQDASMVNPVPTPTKGKKERYVDASGILVRTFEALRGERTKLALANGWRPVPPWVFITNNGTPIAERFIETDFARILKNAKLPDHLTPHSMRHTFACIHIARGCQRSGCNSRWDTPPSP
jgi:integrase